MAAPIEIIIRQEGTGAISNGGSSSIPTSRTTAETPEGVESPIQSQVNTLLINYGKQILQEGTNLYIDYSGNYILNERIQAGISIGSSLLMIAKGGVLGATAVAFDTVNQVIKFNRDVSRKNQQIEFIKRQSGKVVEMGGRYTND